LKDKPLKRLKVSGSQDTQLKQGVNEIPAKAEMSREGREEKEGRTIPLQTSRDKLLIGMYLSFFDKK